MRLKTFLLTEQKVKCFILCGFAVGTGTSRSSPFVFPILTRYLCIWSAAYQFAPSLTVRSFVGYCWPYHHRQAFQSRSPGNRPAAGWLAGIRISVFRWPNDQLSRFFPETVRRCAKGGSVKWTARDHCTGLRIMCWLLYAVRDLFCLGVLSKGICNLSLPGSEGCKWTHLQV